MLFQKHNKVVSNLDLNINGSTIDQVSTFKFLGLQINSQLTWQTHINDLSKRMSRVIGLLYKMKHILPKNIPLSLYNALILPHLNYCILSWRKKRIYIFVT